MILFWVGPEVTEAHPQSEGHRFNSCNSQGVLFYLSALKQGTEPLPAAEAPQKSDPVWWHAYMYLCIRGICREVIPSYSMQYGNCMHLMLVVCFLEHFLIILF